MELAIQEAQNMVTSPFKEVILQEANSYSSHRSKCGKTNSLAFLHLHRQITMLKINRDALLCKVFPRVLTGLVATLFN